MWSNWTAVALLTMQWGLVIHAYFRHKRLYRYMRAVASENTEVWTVLVECTKVLEMHDDFNSRHVSGLIQGLCKKYSPEVLEQRLSDLN